MQFYYPGSNIHLVSIDFRTSLDALYEDVTFGDSVGQGGI
ncbi:hypothetical protein OSCI_3890018 [Kamptonema sp. PCC 6506]|nr:hypothetical protein OSCI_3890018 [Kamptonema sp. PCC 6506]